MKPNSRYVFFLLALIFLSFPGWSQTPFQKIVYSGTSDKVDFGISFLEKNISGTDVQLVFVTTADKKTLRNLSKLGIKNTGELREEGFYFKPSNDGKTIGIIAKDEAGLMYGAFELAEQIQIGGIENVKETFQNPYMKMRGTKFNIPLDVRTPSYSDVSDAAQKNMLEMWNFDFWKEYIDSLARYRYNYISLWSMHPFPSLVKVPEYPDVALDDVHQSTVNWNEHYSLNGHLFTNPEIFENTKIIKKITIDEKIEFWKKVMAYGKSRNVDFYIVTWNIFTYGVDGKYGIDDRFDNETTRYYFRRSVKQLFLTYPDLAGIGLTTGENMYGLSTDEKEDWAFETFGKGVLDAAKELPGRKITFIHRQHMAGAREIANYFQPLVDHPDINFIFSYKYAKAHVYSSVKQPFHESFINDIQQDKELKTIWTLRNDDIFYHRWGAPDFVREFIKNIPHHVSDGYYYGSDQYVWGREFLSKNIQDEGALELAKHWYHWMMWGRLGYNPDMDNERFTDILQHRFPQTESTRLFEAWQNASMIYPMVTGFHWGSLDFQWYIESGQSRPFYAKTPNGYNDLDFFIELPPHPGTDNVSIPEFVEAKFSGKEVEGTSPFELAEAIILKANLALNWANKNHSSGEELALVKNDIQSMSYLGLHYAHKIKAATYLHMYRKKFDENMHSRMLEEMREAAVYWRYYAASSLSINKNPLWTNRVGHVDWRNYYRNVYFEVRAQGGNLNIPSMLPSEGGTILEAEDAQHAVAFKETKIPGFTGTGYLTSNKGHAYISVDWEFDAPEAGKYMLEFRYSLTREDRFPGNVTVNGREVDLIFWESAEPQSWVWDRVVVQLKKGKNTIRVNPEGMVQFDHLNVLPIQ